LALSFVRGSIGITAAVPTKCDAALSPLKCGAVLSPPNIFLGHYGTETRESDTLRRSS